MVHRLFSRIRIGCLVVHEPASDKPLRFGDADAPESLTATLTVHDPSVYRSLLAGGTLSASEAYIEGRWSSDDLYRVLRVGVHNESVYDGLDGPWTAFFTATRDLLHAARRNSRRGSRRNISAHYDLGNEVFAQFLDPTMAYSCAIFPHEQATLEEASREKFDRICRKLELQPDHHVLEIGTGWGGFCLHAAREYGCRVTTTTISKKQFEWSRRRVTEEGLDGRVTVLEKDYRDLQGRFDRLVSIEMIEAVGHRYLDTFFARCASLLKPDGAMALQAISVRDSAYRRHQRAATFINTHIFPGSFLPAMSAMCSSMARCTPLRMVHVEDISPHYVRTLLEWRRRFRTNIDKLRHCGLTDELVRMWDFYFAYCAAAFDAHENSVAQIVFTMPRFRRTRPWTSAT
jgi:cyclopropane-fatty-acyl-phospholipid synthase